MPDKKLFQLLKSSGSKKTENELSAYFISQLIAAGIRYDELHFEKIFAHCMLRYGMKETYSKVIYPVLVRLGLMWASDAAPSSHEHFISKMIQQKLYTAIDSLPPAKSTADTWLLFLPENELHEIGLLFSNYILRQSGRNVIYFGGNIPFKSLTSTIEDISPQHLLLFLIHNDLPKNTQKYLNRLSDNFTGKRIFIAGKQDLIDNVKLGEIFCRLQSVKHLERTVI